jgi:hypothetical protein
MENMKFNLESSRFKVERGWQARQATFVFENATWNFIIPA